MGEFKSPRDTAVGDVVSTWPAHQKSFEDAVIEATGQAAATPFTGRILARLDDKGVASGIASLDASSKVVQHSALEGVANGVATLGADGKVPSAQLPGSAGTAFVGASAYFGAVQNLTNDVPYNLAWTLETFDTSAFHSTVSNNTRMTVPAGQGGYYLVKTQVLLQGTSAVGGSSLTFLVNGVQRASVGGQIGSFGNVVYLALSCVLQLSDGDYVEVQVDPSSMTGPALSPYNNFFQLVRLGS